MNNESKEDEELVKTTTTKEIQRFLFDKHFAKLMQKYIQQQSNRAKQKKTRHHTHNTVDLFNYLTIFGKQSLLYQKLIIKKRMKKQNHSSGIKMIPTLPTAMKKVFWLLFS